MSITVTVPDNISRPLFDLKHGISETGFCLRLQVEPTYVDRIDRGSPSLRTKLYV
jgi:hypothetical protein